MFHVKHHLVHLYHCTHVQAKMFHVKQSIYSINNWNVGHQGSETDFARSRPSATTVKAVEGECPWQSTFQYIKDDSHVHF